MIDFKEALRKTKEKEDTKIKVFNSILNKFETEEIKNYCRDMILKIPDYIFMIPSSSSLKYHNKTQCQKHGQIFHILMFGEIINYILELEYVRERTDERKRDCLRCTPILHDALKCGDGYSLFTVPNHPKLASDWIKNTKVSNDIDQETKNYIARLCESHSGQWNTSNRSNIILPKPETNEQFLVHMCDYLASRANLDMIYDDNILSLLEKCTFKPKFFNPEYEMNFGKYKGQTLEWIKENDKKYFDWMKENITSDPIKSIIEKM